MCRLLARSLFFTSCLFFAACGQPNTPVLMDATGQPLETSGHWLLINYWASWCKPCRQEIPELNELHHELASQSVKVLGYNFDQLEGAALLSAGEQLGIEFPLLSNAAISKLELPGVMGIPVTFLVNPQGQYSDHLSGEQTRASLLAALQKNGALAK